MGRHLVDYKLTDAWVDLTTLDEYTDIAGTAITLQAKYVGEAFVFVGGTEEPEGDQGSLLKTSMWISQTADHWWVKGSGSVSILVEE